jgi:hypothetical protein
VTISVAIANYSDNPVTLGALVISPDITVLEVGVISNKGEIPEYLLLPRSVAYIDDIEVDPVFSHIDRYTPTTWRQYQMDNAFPVEGDLSPGTGQIELHAYIMRILRQHLDEDAVDYGDMLRISKDITDMIKKIDQSLSMKRAAASIGALLRAVVDEPNEQH